MKKSAGAFALAVLVATSASAQTEERVAPTTKGELLLYERGDYGGSEYVIDQARTRISLQWNIGSLGVHPGDKWQICAKPRFKEPCIILDRSVDDAAKIGINGGIGSARLAPQ